MAQKPDAHERSNKSAPAVKDSFLALAIIACCIGVLIVYFNFGTKKPKEKVPYVNTLSPAYSANMSYILNASMEANDKLPDGWFGYFGAHIPIVQEQDFPWLAQRLKEELGHASDYTSMYHMIVVGGMNVQGIDEPMLEAAKRFRVHRRPNVDVVIVSPTTISAETKQILEKRGIRIRLVGPPSRDHFR